MKLFIESWKIHNDQLYSNFFYKMIQQNYFLFNTKEKQLLQYRRYSIVTIYCFSKFKCVSEPPILIYVLTVKCPRNNAAKDKKTAWRYCVPSSPLLTAHSTYFFRIATTRLTPWNSRPNEKKILYLYFYFHFTARFFRWSLLLRLL